MNTFQTGHCEDCSYMRNIITINKHHIKKYEEELNQILDLFKKDIDNSLSSEAQSLMHHVYKIRDNLDNLKENLNKEK